MLRIACKRRRAEATREGLALRGRRRPIRTREHAAGCAAAFPRLVDSQCRRSRSSQQTKPEAAHFFCVAHLILKHRHADRWPMTMRPRASRLPPARPSPEALSSWRPTATPASCAKVRLLYQCVGLDRVLDRGRRSPGESSDAG
jgi:hypothetical protein